MTSPRWVPGAEAIETAMESRPDLVITDIRMPDMDGYEKAARVSPRSADPGPVGKDEDVQEYDFDGFAKPMDMEQFKSIVASALVGTSTTLMSCRRNPSTFVRRSIPSRCVALSLWVL